MQKETTPPLSLVASNNIATPQKPLPKLPPRKIKNKNHTIWAEESYNTAKGEAALWTAVITQAMMDALSRCKKSESRYHKHEAIRWLTGNSKDFIDVCLAAGMNPDHVRKMAKKTLLSPTPWRAEAGKGKRYLERKKYHEQQKLKNKQSAIFSASENIAD